MNIRKLTPFIPPLKSAKIPDRFIFNNGNKYYMFDTKSGEKLARLKVTPMLLKDDSFYRNSEPVNSLYINDLRVSSFARKQGIGSEFAKFVKILSKKLGCKGRVHLVAYNHENPGNAPHKFWKKQGFAATSPEQNSTLDFVLEYDLPVPADMCQGTPMFLENF